MAHLVSLLALSAVIALTGCETVEPSSPIGGLSQAVHPPQPPDVGRDPPHAEVELIYNLWVNDSIRALCAGPDPYFQFDSSKADGTDYPTMRTLLTCMRTGPLVGKSIRLVGRTDPRGTEVYNEKLGLARAERIKRYLVANGIDVTRVQTASLGKEDARPAPADWASDRRVEIQLVE